MSKDKRSLAERFQEAIEMLGKLLNPQPIPARQPIPVRDDQRYTPRRK